MATENVTTKFKVDISDLKKNITEANRQVKQYKAELANASAGMKKGEENADSLTQKIEAQSKIVEAEKAKLQALKDELSRYESTLSKGESTIAELTKKHEEAAAAFGEDSEEAQKLAKQLEKAKEAQERNARAADELRTRIINQDTAVKTAEGRVRDFSDALDELQNEEKQTGDEAEKTTNGGLNAFAVALGNLASQVITKAVSGLGKLVSSVIETGKAFDTSMSKVKAISGATAEEMDTLTQKAEQMGATTKYTATEAADAMGYMAMAGWKTEDMLNGIDGVMNLAAASGAELATTSDIVTDALTAFGQTAAESGRLADIMAAAASNSNTNVEMMGETFKYAASLAGSLGYSMEDVAVSTGLMANSGIKASQAGTTMRSIMTRMSTGAGEAGKAMKELGIRMDDGNGNMKTWLETMKDIRAEFGDLKMSQQDLTAEQNKLNAALETGEIDEDEYDDAMEELIGKAYGAEGAMKAQYATMLAGKNALSGFLAIVNASDEDFDKLTDSIYNSSGAAEQMAQVMGDNLEGSLTLLSSAFDGFKKKIYDGISAPLNGLVKQITANIMPALTGIIDGTPGAEDELADGISNLFSNALKTAAKVLPGSVDALGAVLGAVGDALVRQAPEAIDGAVRLLERILDGVINALPKMVKGIGRIVKAIANGVAKFVPHIMDSIVNVLPDLSDALFGVLPSLMTALEKIAVKVSEKLPEISKKIVDFLPGFVKNVADFLVTQTPKLLRAGLEIVTGLVKALPGVLKAVIDALPKVLDALGEALPELLESVFDVLIECSEPLLDALTKLIIMVADNLPEIITPVVDQLPKILDKIGAVIVKLAPVLWDALKTTIKHLITVLPVILETLWNALSEILDPVAKQLADVWLKIEESFKNTGEFFRNIWNEIKDAFSSVGKFFKGVWEEAVENTENTFENVVKFFSGIWKKIKKTFTDLGTKIGDAVGGAFKSTMNGVFEFIEGKLNMIPDAINGAIETLNKIPGVDISPLDTITLPRLGRGGIVNSPTIAEIGEAGREAVIPLERNKQGLRDIAQLLRDEIGSLGGGGSTTNITNAGKTTNISYTQNLTSPKALSQYDIYRQTQNMLRMIKAQEV